MHPDAWKGNKSLAEEEEGEEEEKEKDFYELNIQ